MMPNQYRRPARSAPIGRARTCYDHLAGMLGVGIFDALVRAGAIGPPAVVRGDLVVRPAAAEVFGRLGIDLSRVPRGRRRYAYGCLDWTERRFHLGGALGAAVCDRFFEAGWIRRRADSRAVDLTPAGRDALEERLALRV